jgi:23S rRNA (cytosine1962-C5)-methyltransferase
MITIPTHQHTIARWEEYQLLDSGDGEKLERYGKYVLRRPEPQALWPRTLTREWDEQWHAHYVRQKGIGDKLLNNERGEWIRKKGMPESWNMGWTHNGVTLTFRLALTSFGHIGVFPEQSDNWEWIMDAVKSSGERPRVLNLFAYTGGATLAANAAGAEVTHVDSIKQTVTWANQNLAASGLQGVRWMIEDAIKFVQREVKRGNRYQGIILDPPAYGRGPAGEKWVLEEHLQPLMEACARLLDPAGAFGVVNTYSMGHSAVVLHNLVCAYVQPKKLEMGELTIASAHGVALPLSTFIRFTI